MDPPAHRVPRQARGVLSDGRRYLFGEHIIEADIRLYTTLARFDAVYHPVFMCNLRSIWGDYPRLYLWLRRLYWDREEEGQARVAFYETTEPCLRLYRKGYATARHGLCSRARNR